MSGTALKVMVLVGGPDRERSVSFMSGRQVTAALVHAGHDVRQCQIGPDELDCLDEFVRWRGDVIFPALHGAWGEGGTLQHLLDERELVYVGSSATAASLCMDKHRAKMALIDHGLPTPPHEIVGHDEPVMIEPPIVIKPLCEGSSIDLRLCLDGRSVDVARKRLGEQYKKLLVERYVAGQEMTVGVVGGADGDEALPPIHIIPATEFYDYQAKYERDDTQFIFDDLPLDQDEDLRHLALKTHTLLGCRHLSRVDFIVDDAGQPWILEVNTIPGFTGHSLVPMAAARIGMNLDVLVDHLTRLAFDTNLVAYG